MEDWKAKKEEVYKRYAYLISLVDNRLTRQFPYPYLRGIVYYQLYKEGYSYNMISQAANVNRVGLIYITRKVEDIVKGRLKGYFEIERYWFEFNKKIK